MLTSKEMTPDEFSGWKEANKWFFNELKVRQQYYKEQADSLLARFSAAPFSFTDQEKQVMIAMNHRGQMLQDLIDIDYESVVEVEE